MPSQRPPKLPRSTFAFDPISRPPVVPPEGKAKVQGKTKKAKQPIDKPPLLLSTPPIEDNLSPPPLLESVARDERSGKDKKKGTRTAKGTGKVAPDYVWHPSVDYAPLGNIERQSRAFLDLFTIFTLGKRDGISLCEVQQMAAELDMKELANLSLTTMRNTIQRWNTLVISTTNDGRRCDHIGCKNPASFGHWTEDPMTCDRHKKEDMIQLVHGRLVQLLPGSNPTYLMTDPLFSRLFPPLETFKIATPPGEQPAPQPSQPSQPAPTEINAGIFDLTYQNELDEILAGWSDDIPAMTTIDFTLYGGV